MSELDAPIRKNFKRFLAHVKPIVKIGPEGFVSGLVESKHRSQNL